MEPNAKPPSLRARFVTCRICFGLGLLVCLAIVVAGVTMPWLVPPDLSAAVARLRATSGGSSGELLVAVERNPWKAEDGRGPLLFGDAALWLAVAGTVLGLLSAVRARGLPPFRPVALLAMALWLVGAGLVGANLRMYRNAHLDALTPWGARAGSVAYRVERETHPRVDTRFSERTRLGPVGWGTGMFVTLAGLLGGTGLLALAARPAGRPREESGTGQP